MPQVEAEFAQLNRDYDIQKKTYETLLAREQSATLGEGVQDAGGTQFRVIDPPRVLPQPVPPTRMLLLGFAMLRVGGRRARRGFAAAELKPTFHDARSLRRSRPSDRRSAWCRCCPSETLSRRRRRKHCLFAGGMGGLVASFVAVLAFAVLVARPA